MTKHTHTRGFTLIELLVVIAIIGILASVVLASLNSARDKGADAAIKSNLNNARAQAELYYDDHSRSYASLCSAGINTMTAGAASAGSWTVVNTATVAGTASTVICHDSAGAWAVAAPLKSTSGQYYCVDSTGKATTGASTLGISDYTC
jgi:prepilin-type N-terminal cleavage/methylation domain-containing protein